MQNTIESKKSGFNPWKAFVRLQNPFMKWLLNSSLHPVVSKWYMLIHVTGRKSGNIYTIPVQYKQVGNALYIISSKNYHWWRNLHGGAEISLQLRGENISASATVEEDFICVEKAFKALYPGVKEATRLQMCLNCVAIEITL